MKEKIKNPYHTPSQQLTIKSFRGQPLTNSGRLPCATEENIAETEVMSSNLNGQRMIHKNNEKK